MLLVNTVGNAKRTIGSLPVERAVRIVPVILLVRSKTSNGNGNGWKFKGHIIFSNFQAPLERAVTCTLGSVSAGQGLEGGSVTSVRRTSGGTPMCSASPATATPVGWTQRRLSVTQKLADATVWRVIKIFVVCDKMFVVLFVLFAINFFLFQLENNLFNHNILYIYHLLHVSFIYCFSSA